MAIQSNILNIPLDGTGTEIPTLNVSDPYEKYLITGANTAIGNYAIVPTGSPQQGTTFLFKYKATTDITTNGTTFAIFGSQLTQNQLLIELDIECYYTGSAWVVEVKPSLTTQFLETVNIVAGAIGTTQIANLSVTTGKLANDAVTTVKILDQNVTTAKIADDAVTTVKILDTNVTTSKLTNNAVTNGKLAQMTSYTLKGNNTGSTADPQDISASTLFNANAWSLTGNSGTVAGTNFIGTTDAIDLVFKYNSILSGKIDQTNVNTSFGFQSLLYNVTGSNNTAIGNSALQTTTNGVGNVAIGEESLFGVTSGESNVGVGNSAAYSLTTGDNNTVIGTLASVSSNASLNRIALGYGASATADYQFAIPDDVTTIKFKGLTYTLPTSLPGADAVLHCSSTGVLTWV